jgi:hypothetical protein
VILRLEATLGTRVGSFLEKPTPATPQASGADATAARPLRPGVFGDARFVPARWLVVVLTILRLLVRGGKLGKLGIAGLVWSVAPRKLKLVVAGFAVAAAIVLVGAIAAITLLVVQLS